MLKVLPVCVVGKNSVINTFAFLDDGSTVTLIDADFARSIGVRGERLNVQMRGIRDVDASLSACEKVSFEIRSDDFEYKIQNALAAPSLCLPSQTLPGELVRYIARTQSIFLQPYNNAIVKILIGQDNWRLLLSHEFRAVGEDYAISRTPLGWALHGIIHSSPVTAPSSLHIQTFEKNYKELEYEEKCDILIKQFFDLESLGIRETSLGKDRFSRALKILESTSRRIDSGWETGLLWKSDNIPPADSRVTALKRLASLERRLDRDACYADLYYKEMDRFFDRGYATKVNEDTNRPRIWFLPHFGVTSESKPGKVRLVFDAAAKTSGFSLNDQLDTGPDLLQNLFGILIRFREYPVAVSADIKDMYLRVKLREEDRGALRFLWRGRDRIKRPEVYEMTCLVFGANSSPTSAIFVKDTNARTFSKTFPDAAASIIRNSYVDDFLASTKTDAQAATLVRDVININAAANFEMHRWASNHPDILAVEENEMRRSVQTLAPLGDHDQNRVLGMFWDTKLDTLSFNVGMKRIEPYLQPDAKIPTKRDFLKCIMSVYDPLGLLVPFTLKSKLIMQNVWRSKIAWDEPLRIEEYEEWKSWLQVMLNLLNFKIPRCLSPNFLYKNIQLHVFCDASLKAYAAGVYLRFLSNDQSTHSVLVMAKSRVAPVKPLSVPRLELQAALLAARLLNSVERELSLKVDKRLLWSDSQTVLHWIRSEPITRQIYVAHRLAEIHEITSVAEWRWVPTKLNPADCATRGICDEKAVISTWFNGPNFLSQNEVDWPQQKALTKLEKDAADKLELRKVRVHYLNFSLSQSPLYIRLLGWSRLLIIARRIRKFFIKWLNYKRRFASNQMLSNTVDELIQAEEFTIRRIQIESFSNEISCLLKNKPIPKCSKILSLSPTIDCNGFLRANGRINDEKFPTALNCPIILEGKHLAVKLLIKEYHCRYKHSSNETVLNEIRQIYHVIGARNVLKSVIAHCLICKIRRAKPLTPLMAPLPASRQACNQRPFSHCGIDYFGPLYVRVRRSTEKRWGVLFTCLTTRAIHLEIANNLSLNSAILALQRLAGRRGTPTDIYSDNGTNFRGACAELIDCSKKLSEMRNHIFLLKNNVRWHFNPPDAPHMGGAWERMIRTVKVALYATLNHEVPQEEVLHTILLEIEHIVNSRPLTHVSIDPRDEEALTPNHFLIGTSSGNFQLGSVSEISPCSRKLWQQVQIQADKFWRRWLREYLPTLLPRKKWCERIDSIQENDIVLIADLQAPRNVWRRGRVVEVFPGKDNIVRSAKISTSKGDFIRPVHKLVKLFREEVKI